MGIDPATSYQSVRCLTALTACTCLCRMSRSADGPYVYPVDRNNHIGRGQQSLEPLPRPVDHDPARLHRAYHFTRWRVSEALTTG